ncbi:MAG TPA: glutathione transferase GstA [Sphingomicrobium sp.]|nr:glutathione transferase GstA [Sphingomicrobium sp.]
MKLYYSPGACSQAPHILLHEIGLHHDAERVDLKAKTLEGGGSYLDVNPKGSVPALALDSGEVLTENAVILQYLGDRAGGSDVLPPLGDFRRYRVLELTNFITTELHKSFAPLFKPDAGDETKLFFRQQISQRLDYIERKLGAGPFLMGDTLTIADPYLFVISGWTDMLIGLNNWPNVTAFRERMLQRPSVRNVLRFEGLLKEELAG